MAKARGTKRSGPVASLLLADGTLMLAGIIGDEVDGLTAAKVTEEIRSLGEVDELHVLLNSNGGLMDHGLAIYHELATHPATVTIEIAGVAASMASAIAMAGDVIKIARNGHIMIHDPMNVSVGTADDHRRAAEMLEEFGTSLVDIYATRTGLPEDEIREMLKAETWLTAQEALDKGFVDEIIDPVEADAFADLDVGELASVPAALTRLIREGRQMARQRTTGKTTPPKRTAAPATPPREPAAARNGPDPVAAARRAAQEELQAERQRVTAIRALARQVGLDQVWAENQINAVASVDEARAAAIDALADRQARDGGPSFLPSGAGVTVDQRDKWRDGVVQWLLVKAGYADLIEQHTKQRPDPGEFRGLRLLDIARDALHFEGVQTRGMLPMQIAAAALWGGARVAQAATAGQNTTSDFPILLENVLHKLLQAAYDTAADQWRSVAATGSVQDFRPHPRLRLGSLARLEAILESGEFRFRNFPDAEKETIKAGTFGNVVGLTRQAIVNDDVDGFSRMTFMLGRAAARSIEIDLFALFGLNSGLGPTMSDGNPLFHATHNNIDATGAVPSVDRFEAMRVLMAQQTDPDGNDFLNLRPDVFVGPIGLGAAARVAIQSEFDFAAGGTNPQFRKPNVVRDLLSTIVDTPRLTGTRYYVLADPAIAPVFEVVFLEGQESPMIEVAEPFGYDGVKWQIKHDYGVGATDFRGGVTNAGA